jgi:hypothetical protein
MAQRLTYRRRHCYATRSNKTRVVKTPGAPAAGFITVRVKFIYVGVPGAVDHTWCSFRARATNINADNGWLLGANCSPEPPRFISWSHFGCFDVVVSCASCPLLECQRPERLLNEALVEFLHWLCAIQRACCVSAHLLR